MPEMSEHEPLTEAVFLTFVALAAEDLLAADFASVESLGYYDLQSDDSPLGFYAINGDVEIGNCAFYWIGDDRARGLQWGRPRV